MKFSGHQTFPLRISWLPKAVEAFVAGEDPLTNPEKGIVDLGLGKNMVTALRFWVDAYNVATYANSKWTMTQFGDLVFNPDSGADPFLEDPATAWLLHWQISTRRNDPLFAWDTIINRWNDTHFSPSQMMEVFRRGAEKFNKGYSDVTLRQHLDIFIHTYCSTRSGTQEDNLDSPLSDIGLIQNFGDRETESGSNEVCYRIDTLCKHSINDALFRYALEDWWNANEEAEDTMPLKEIASGANSPGRVFRLPETDIHDHLSQLAKEHPHIFHFTESLNQRQIQRARRTDMAELLCNVYSRLNRLRAWLLRHWMLILSAYLLRLVPTREVVSGI